MRVLAIDPALRKTGYAVLECEGVSGREFRTLTYGVIENRKSLLPSACLVAIRETLHEVILKHSPGVCAIESVIYVQSYRTAITLGAARGAAIIAAAEHGLSVHEYPPKRVKQAVVGKGGADKTQVAFMIRSLLGLTETPPLDASDALAIGITHLHAHDPSRPLPPDAKQV